MGKIIRCGECGFTYRTLEDIEYLHDNDSVCIECGAEIEVANWDRVLESYEEDEEDLDDVEDDEEEEEDEEKAEGWDEDEDVTEIDDDDVEYEDEDEDEADEDDDG